MITNKIKIKHNVYRIKSLNYMPIIAYWTDNGDLNVMDVKSKFLEIGGGENPLEYN